MIKTISKISYYFCWLAIIIVSFVYAASSFSPWNAQKFNLLEPSIHLDTKYYALQQQIYWTAGVDRTNNQYLIEKARNFHSGVGSEFQAQTFFRPDFDQFPTETILVLFFRLLTYTGIILFFFLFSQILQSVFKEDPFSPKNHNRLFYLGCITIVIPIIRVLHSLVLSGYVRRNPALLGYDVGPSYLPLWLVLFGVFILILSFLFKETARIHEEQKLTV